MVVQYQYMLCFGCMISHIHELREDGWWYCPNCGHKRHTTPTEYDERSEMVKTYEVKIFRKRGECETIRNLTPIQMVALEEVFSHYGVSYKKFAYDGNRLESVDWVEAPNLLATLEVLVTDIDECETQEDFVVLAAGGAIEQARTALAKVKGG